MTNTQVGGEVKLLSPYWEWRYEIGTKTQPAHAYLKNEYGGDWQTMPPCGGGCRKGSTKTKESASKKRLYPIFLCGRCVEHLEEQGAVYVHRSSDSGKR